MTSGPSPEQPGNRWALGAVLLLVLAVRVVAGVRQPGGEAGIDALPDQREYLELGRNLLAGRGLQFTDARFNDRVWAYRTPGYPLWVAACGGRVGVVRAAQAALDTSTVLAAYLLARWWLPRRPSVLAAGIVAVNPFLIYFSGLVLSETLFTALLAWGLVLLVHSGGPWPAGGRATGAWLGGGLLLAVAALVRPSAALLPVAAATAGAFANRGLLPNFNQPGEYHWRWPLPIGATFLGLTALVLLPWGVRNQLRLHAWVFTSTNAGITRYDGFNPDATGASDQSFVANLPALRQMGEVGRSRYLDRLADDYIREHPAAVAKLTIFKIARTWSPVPLSRQYGSRKLYVAAGLLYSLPLLVLTAAGLASGRCPGRQRRFCWRPRPILRWSTRLRSGRCVTESRWNRRWRW